MNNQQGKNNHSTTKYDDGNMPKNPKVYKRKNMECFHISAFKYDTFFYINIRLFFTSTEAPEMNNKDMNIDMDSSMAENFPFGYDIDTIVGTSTDNGIHNYSDMVNSVSTTISNVYGPVPTFCFQTSDDSNSNVSNAVETVSSISDSNTSMNITVGNGVYAPVGIDSETDHNATSTSTDAVNATYSYYSHPDLGAHADINSALSTNNDINNTNNNITVSNNSIFCPGSGVDTVGASIPGYYAHSTVGYTYGVTTNSIRHTGSNHSIPNYYFRPNLGSPIAENVDINAALDSLSNTPSGNRITTSSVYGYYLPPNVRSTSAVNIGSVNAALGTNVIISSRAFTSSTPNFSLYPNIDSASTVNTGINAALGTNATAGNRIAHSSVPGFGFRPNVCFASRVNFGNTTVSGAGSSMATSYRGAASSVSAFGLRSNVGSSSTMSANINAALGTFPNYTSHSSGSEISAGLNAALGTIPNYTFRSSGAGTNDGTVAAPRTAPGFIPHFNESGINAALGNCTSVASTSISTFDSSVPAFSSDPIVIPRSNESGVNAGVNAAPGNCKRVASMSISTSDGYIPVFSSGPTVIPRSYESGVNATLDTCTSIVSTSISATDGSEPVFSSRPSASPCFGSNADVTSPASTNSDLTISDIYNIIESLSELRSEPNASTDPSVNAGTDLPIDIAADFDINNITGSIPEFCPPTSDSSCPGVNTVVDSSADTTNDSNSISDIIDSISDFCPNPTVSTVSVADICGTSTFTTTNNTVNTVTNVTQSLSSPSTTSIVDLTTSEVGSPVVTKFDAEVDLDCDPCSDTENATETDAIANLNASDILEELENFLAASHCTFSNYLVTKQECYISNITTKTIIQSNSVATVDSDRGNREEDENEIMNLMGNNDDYDDDNGNTSNNDTSNNNGDEQARVQNDVIQSTGGNDTNAIIQRLNAIEKRFIESEQRNFTPIDHSTNGGGSLYKFQQNLTKLVDIQKQALEENRSSLLKINTSQRVLFETLNQQGSVLQTLAKKSDRDDEFFTKLYQQLDKLFSVKKRQMQDDENNLGSTQEKRRKIEYTRANSNDTGNVGHEHSADESNSLMASSQSDDSDDDYYFETSRFRNATKQNPTILRPDSEKEQMSEEQFKRFTSHRYYRYSGEVDKFPKFLRRHYKIVNRFALTENIKYQLLTSQISRNVAHCLGLLNNSVVYSYVELMDKLIKEYGTNTTIESRCLAKLSSLRRIVNSDPTTFAELYDAQNYVRKLYTENMNKAESHLKIYMEYIVDNKLAPDVKQLWNSALKKRLFDGKLSTFTTLFKFVGRRYRYLTENS
ncbi:DgyrCDS13660 [Dimorphilus gyrociliatus]|uniref:DgyrCDS13660 n=1 Tax=Dimorphilus gyrociliatus TaxID=2664684 RepID=A0A7I8WBC0_9ANNE|nr:DgyrCDS13660 [Dimorphilus gyrociliatus]